MRRPRHLSDLSEALEKLRGIAGVLSNHSHFH